MFAKLTDSLKREFSSIASSGARHMVFGSLFLLVSVIFLCAASVPLWTGRIRMFPGGRVFRFRLLLLLYNFLLYLRLYYVRIDLLEKTLRRALHENRTRYRYFIPFQNFLASPSFRRIFADPCIGMSVRFYGFYSICHNKYHKIQPPVFGYIVHMRCVFLFLFDVYAEIYVF